MRVRVCVQDDTGDAQYLADTPYHADKLLAGIREIRQRRALRNVYNSSALTPKGSHSWDVSHHSTFMYVCTHARTHRFLRVIFAATNDQECFLGPKLEQTLNEMWQVYRKADVFEFSRQ